ncbi:hypothetical protein P3566_22040 [Vibrio parahaemolyticus]|nr:hypothetical protein [Vibrio parahaemolyticus]HBB9946510.1 hypothetical protein [Vibrio parahaemolyticus]
MQTIDFKKDPFTFESFFQAESYLEKQGYHCENERWICDGEPNVSVVANERGVQIQPIQH